MRKAIAALLTSLGLLLAASSSAPASTEDGPARAAAFLGRVFKALPSPVVEEFTFSAWSVSSNPTKEGFGLLKTSAPVDVDRLASLVMAVDKYKGNLDHVVECYTVPDVRFHPPVTVHFHQKVNIPMVNDLQHDLVLNDAGVQNGYRVLYWYDLEAETAALKPENGARSAYSVGLWLISKDAVGYGVSNAPYREDVSTYEWTALTTGSDALASPVVRKNIEGLIAWSKR